MLASSSANTQSNPLGEKRVALHGLNWSAYQQIKALLNERPQARLTYDCGALEITTPSQPHEFAAEMIGLFIRILAVEMGL